MRSTPFCDPDPLGGVPSLSLAEHRPKPTQTKFTIFPSRSSDTRIINYPEVLHNLTSLTLLARVLGPSLAGNRTRRPKTRMIIIPLSCSAFAPGVFLFYFYIIWLLSRPGIVDFGGLGGPGGRETPFQKGGALRAQLIGRVFPADEPAQTHKIVDLQTVPKIMY
jgi:hypothetical protein